MSFNPVFPTLFGSGVSGATKIGSVLGSQVGLFTGTMLGGAAPWYTLGKADGTDPSFWADFVNKRYAANGAEKAFSDIFTFARSTIGTYFDANGVMQTAAIGTPRFDHNPATGEPLGLLTEGQRTNLIVDTNPQSILWYVSGATKTNTTGTMVGTLTTPVIVSSNGAQWHRLQSSNLSVTSGTAYAWTAFVANDVGANIIIQMRNDTAATESYVTGTLGSLLSPTSSSFGSMTNDKVVAVSGGYIYYGTFTPNATVSTARFGVGPNSAKPGDSIIFYGAQVEVGSFPSSYIPTSGSSVTRSADYVANTGSNNVPFSSWYNQVEGCLFTEAKAAYNTATTARRIAEISDGSLNNRWFHNIEGSAGNNVSIFVNSGGVTQFSSVSALTSNEFRKFASSVKTDGAYAIGGSIATDATVTMPASVNQLNIGQSYSGNHINGWIKSIRYYPARISNIELQRITNA